ncbi:MAG: class I SAM-dependent methyltransferase [Candidatus Saccharimonadales bacterium]
MSDKKLIDLFARRLKGGGLKITYLDGESRQYGNGPKYFDLVIKQAGLAKQLIKNPPLGFAEAYINGQLEVSGDLTQIIRLLMNNQQIMAYDKLRYKTSKTSKRLQPAQIRQHNDLGNDLFRKFLGPTMLYTAANYNSSRENLSLAQKRKAQLILEALRLKKGQRLLDIGCGWGYLSVQAAKVYNVHVHGITLSPNQLKFCRELAVREGVSNLVDFELVNFLDFKPNHQFQAVMSIECVESIAKRYQPSFFSKMAAVMSPDGRVVLQISTIAGKSGLTEPFLDKYVFPGLYVPAQWELLQGLANAGLRVEALSNLRSDYYLTTKAWLTAIRTHRQWIENQYDQRQFRILELYMAGMVGTAKYGNLDTLRLTLTPQNTILPG